MFNLIRNQELQYETGKYHISAYQVARNVNGP